MNGDELNAAAAGCMRANPAPVDPHQSYPGQMQDLSSKSTLALAVDNAQELDGRLSALLNELALIEEKLNGPTTADAPEEAQLPFPNDVPAPSGSLGALARSLDNMDTRLRLLSHVVGRMHATLG